MWQVQPIVFALLMHRDLMLLPVTEVIIDRVRDARDQRRQLESIEGIMIHRVGVDLKEGLLIGYEAVSICDAFTGKDPKWKMMANATGRQNPYTFYVGGSLGPDEYDGKIWQALRLDEVGHHALRFSKRYIGVALIGDFRVRPPSERQWVSAIDLCSDLCLLFGFVHHRIVGHGEMPGAYGDKNKAPGKPNACPGAFLNMDNFRYSVRDEMGRKVQQDAYNRIIQSGLWIPRSPARPF